MQKFLVTFLCIALLASTANAATTVWNPTEPNLIVAGGANWGNVNNWTNGIPTVADKVVFNVDGAAECQVTDEQLVGTNMVQGDNGPGGVIRIMDGGTLSQENSSWWSVGFNNTAKLIVEKGGFANFKGHCWWGKGTGADAIVEINGGKIYNEQSFGLGEWFGPADNHGQCKVYINEGELNIHHWTGAIDSDHPVFWNDSLINIQFGKMIIRNDSMEAAQEYIDAGKITGFGIVGNVNLELINGETVMTSDDPMKASPTLGAEVVAGDVVLSWTNKDPMNGSTPVVDVWFGTDADPNVLTGNFKKTITAGVGTTSVTVNAPDTATYYWQVNLVGSDNPDPNSPIYYFNASNDLPPYDVKAGVDMITWTDQPVQLGGEVQLGGTYEDDGVSTVTITWSSDDPNAVFSPSADGGVTSNAINPTVTVDYKTDVTLTFSVKDVLNDAVTDDVIIEVYADACEAARDGVGTTYDGDFNNDCRVDMVDLATEIAAKWLLEFELKDPIVITE